LSGFLARSICQCAAAAEPTPLPPSGPRAVGLIGKGVNKKLGSERGKWGQGRAAGKQVAGRARK
jgi:hypothetical protein